MLTPAAAMATAVEPEPGILVDEAVHELPAPYSSMASDGRALVVYQSADPTDPDSGCTTSGGACSVLGAIIGDDGVTVGEPFLVSGDVLINYYFSSPSAVWNEDRNEWLVLMTSYDEGFQTVYAQRVSSAGAVVGPLVELPTETGTTADDRGTPLGDAEYDDFLLPSATWSSVDQAYLVTWHARTDPEFVDGVNISVRRIFGYLMTGELTSKDGVDAPFLLSDADAFAETWSTQGYSTAGDEWVVAWGSRDGSDRALFVTSVGYDTDGIEVSPSVQVAGPGDVDSLKVQGGAVWVDSRNAWLVSWGATADGGPRFEAFGRYVSGDLVTGDEILSSIITMSDFGTTRAGTPVNSMRSHDLYYDAASDTVHAAGTILFDESVESLTNAYSAVYWTFDPASGEPGEAIELVAPDAEGDLVASSRARLSGFGGDLGIVYQNWPAGAYEDPAEVRFVGSYAPAADPGTDEGQPELADTGAVDIANAAVLGALLLLLGGVSAAFARGRSARAE